MTKLKKNLDISNSEVSKRVERMSAPLSIVYGTNTEVKKMTSVKEFLETLQRTDEEAMSKRNHVRILANENHLEYQKLKGGQNSSLCGFIPGTFSKRNDNSCEEYLSLLVFDIDGVSSIEDTLSIVGDAAVSPFIFAAFPSPSYKGCRILVWTNATPKTHKLIYQAVSNHLSAILSISTDKELRKKLKSENLADEVIKSQIKNTPHIDSNTSNISRHFYYTPVGEDIYLNLDSQDFIVSEKQPKQDDFIHIKEILPTVKQELLEKIARQRGKGRNCTTFDIACMFFENGISEADTLAYCSQFEELHTSDRFDANEIEKAVKSAYKSVSSKNGINKYSDAQFVSYANKMLGETVVKSLLGENYYIKSKKSKSKTVNNAKLGDKIPKIDIIENYLTERYDFRYNNLSNDLEYKKKKGKDYEILNENDLTVELYKQGINGFRPQLEALMGSSYVVEEYDPIRDYCNQLPKWSAGQTDYIKQLTSYINTPDDDWFYIQLKKMLVRTLACALGKIPFNKQCFTLLGKQNDGKSTFVRFLCPPTLQNYFTEDIDFQSKDGRIALANNFIINLDELDSLQFKEVALVKKFMTTSKIKARIPFAKKATTMIRRVSFFGTTNEAEFLTDTTGNVRWLVMKINGIKHDFGGKNGYEYNVDIDSVYSQVYALLCSGFDYQLSKEEEIKSALNNRSHQVQTPEMDLVETYFEPTEKDKGDFVNTTFIANEIQSRTSIKVYPKQVGKALRFLGFEQMSGRMKNKKSPSKGYWVKKLYDIDRVN